MFSFPPNAVSPRHLRDSWFILLLALIAGALFPAGAEALETLLPKSTSRSHQFIVIAQEGTVRGGIATLSEDTKDGLLGILGLKDEWKLPILISLRKPDPGLPDALPPRRLLLAQTGTGLKVELDLLIGEAGRGTRIRDEIVRTLLLELAYRDHDTASAGQCFTVPPAWLVEGLSAYLENQEDGVSANLFAALLPATQEISILTFLGRDPATMDSTSRSLYRAYAYNLVCLLLRDMSKGRGGLVALIHDLPFTSAEEASGAVALRRHFTELGTSDDSLEKWWTLGLAQLAVSDRYQLYSVAETDKRLEALLTFTGPGSANVSGVPKAYTIHDYKEFAALKEKRKLLLATRVGLAELSGRASPLCRSIVIGYQEEVDRLSRGNTGHAEEKLRALELARKIVLQQREEISDYLNWYEATQVTSESGDFEEYFRSARQVDLSQRVHRPDAVSTYLDNLELEFR